MFSALAVVACTLYQSVVVKGELSQKARLSVHWTINVLTLANEHNL